MLFALMATFAESFFNDHDPVILYAYNICIISIVIKIINKLLQV